MRNAGSISQDFTRYLFARARKVSVRYTVPVRNRSSQDQYTARVSASLAHILAVFDSRTEGVQTPSSTQELPCGSFLRRGRESNITCSVQSSYRTRFAPCDVLRLFDSLGIASRLRRGRESNPRMAVLQTAVLPLHHHAVFIFFVPVLCFGASSVRFEPQPTRLRRTLMLPASPVYHHADPSNLPLSAVFPK